MTALWHPFADMAAVETAGELVLQRGIGCTVWDEGGRSYLDVTAGLWFVNVGHGRKSIAQAVAEQAERLAAHSTFGDLANRPALALAERVAGLAPVPDSKVFFTSGGSDSVDTAVKMARKHGDLLGHPERRVIVVRDRAYHGMHLAGTALSGIDDNRTGYGDLDPDVVRVPWDDAAALADTLDRLDGRAVAFFCEPVIGAGGVFAAGEDYLRAARRVCRERGVLFVADEVICGFGRTGDWFASGRFGLDPDLMLVAKGITSGYVPLGAVVAAPSVWEPFWSRAGLWRHGYTYSGHAVAAAAAMANLDLMVTERLPERALHLEKVLAGALAPLRAHPLVGDVRAGTGLLGAVQLVDPAQIPALVSALRERQILTRGIVTGSVQISPSLVIEERQITQLVDGLTDALGELAERMTLFAPGLLNGRVALVSGGGSGIGRATALELAGLGCQVAVLGRRQETLDETVAMAEAAGAVRVSAYAVDVREPDLVDAVLDRVGAELGPVDILVNDAGGQFVSPAEAISLNGFRAVTRLNLDAVWSLTTSVANRWMVGAGYGKVVSVVISPRRAMPGMAHSAAARAGVENMTRTMAVEWGRYGIRLNCVAPGIIHTEAWERYGLAPEAVAAAIPAGTLGTAEDVAHAITYLVSPAGDYVTGATLLVDGGLDNTGPGAAWFGQQ